MVENHKTLTVLRFKYTFCMDYFSVPYQNDMTWIGLGYKRFAFCFISGQAFLVFSQYRKSFYKVLAVGDNCKFGTEIKLNNPLAGRYNHNGYSIQIENWKKPTCWKSWLKVVRI